MSNDNQGVPAYREVTFAGIALGILQGCVMTMAFVYAGLKLGFTLGGSTIAAIMGFALLKGVLKKGTILENNINQTVASGINISSAGIVFTLPVLFMMMRDFNPVYVAMAAIGGSFLGVAVIIPLRKQMVDFDRLRFPSGTAVAAILKSPGAGREKAMLLGAGFLCSALAVVFKHKGFIPEELSLTALGFPEYTQTAIYLSLMNLGAGMLAGRGGLPFFLGGCIAFWLVAPSGVELGLAHGVPENELTGFVYFSWIRPIGIGMLIGGALMGVIMAFPSIKSAFKSLAKASKASSSSSNDELPIGMIILGIVCAFVVLFCGALFGVKDDTWVFEKNSIPQFSAFLQEARDESSANHKYVFSAFSSETQEMATSKLDAFDKDQDEQRLQERRENNGQVSETTERRLQREKNNYQRKLQKAMTAELNGFLGKKDFYAAERFAGFTFSAATQKLIASHQKQPSVDIELEKMNRLILEEICPGTIEPVGVDPEAASVREVTVAKALLIALVATLWLALAGIIVAQCTGITDISPLSGLSLIAITLILGLSGNNILAAVLLGVAVCVATGQCADMMQDLKTGYMVGGIPRKQQYLQLSVAWIGPIIAITTLYILDAGQGFGNETLPAPQAGALQGMINAVVGGNVPLDKYACGGILGGLLSTLPGGGMGVLVGLAMYLPFSITFGYGIGCFVTMGVAKIKGSGWAEDKIVPLAAGLIVGEAMTELGFSLLKIVQG